MSRKPMADMLGWDVANKHALSEVEGAGLTEVFKPVIHEESIKVAGAESYLLSEAHFSRARVLTCSSMEAY